MLQLALQDCYAFGQIHYFVDKVDPKLWCFSPATKGAKVFCKLVDFSYRLSNYLHLQQHIVYAN